MRYVDIDKHVYVRYIDERSGEVVTSVHTIAEILDSTVGLFPIEEDVEKVVRCKDCKWYKTNYSWNGNEHHVCVIEPYEPVRKEDDFCSRGERRE